MNHRTASLTTAHLDQRSATTQQSHECGYPTWFDRAWLGMATLCGVGSVLLAVEVAVALANA